MNTHKKLFYKIFVLLIVVVVLSTTAFAATPENIVAPTASYQIQSISSGITKANGQIVVTYHIQGTSTMLDIGVTDIYIYQNDLNGNHSTAAEFHSTNPNHSYLMGHNTNKHNGEVYINATPGYEYHAYVFYKASNSSGTDTRTDHTVYITA